MMAKWRSDVHTARELEGVVGDVKVHLRNLEHYRRAVQRAKETMDRSRRGAIDTLNQAIAIARGEGILPDRRFGPTEGEILVMKLYYEIQEEGDVSEDAKRFRRYFESSYPDFPMAYFQIPRMQKKYFQERLKPAGEQTGQ
jgi:hypothetical protein